MKRKALIIEASQVPKMNDLPGARLDAVNWRAWLESKPGGAWFPQEIKTLSTPTCAQVDQEVAAMAGADYGVVVFSGHAHHLRGSKNRTHFDDTSVFLKDGERLVKQLEGRCAKLLMVVDACRELTVLTEEVVRFAARAAFADSGRPASLFREQYESDIMKATSGRVVMYSCDIDETATENGKGGLFTHHLLSGADAWAQSQWRRATYYTADSFNYAAPKTTADNWRQHPKYEPGRRISDFPFAVWVP